MTRHVRQEAHTPADRRREQEIRNYLSMSPEELHEKAVGVWHKSTYERDRERLQAEALALDQLALVSIKGQKLLESSEGDPKPPFSVQLHREAVEYFVDAWGTRNHQNPTVFYERTAELCRLAMDAQNQEGVVAAGVAPLIGRMGVTREVEA